MNISLVKGCPLKGLNSNSQSVHFPSKQHTDKWGEKKDSVSTLYFYWLQEMMNGSLIHLARYVICDMRDTRYVKSISYVVAKNESNMRRLLHGLMAHLQSWKFTPACSVLESSCTRKQTNEPTLWTCGEPILNSDPSIEIEYPERGGEVQICNKTFLCLASKKENV